MSSSSSSSSSDSDDSFSKKFDDNQELLSKKKGIKKRGITIATKECFTISKESDSSDEETENDILYDKQLKDYSKNKNNRNTFNIPWTEKYRPNCIEDLVIDKYSYEKISRILSEKKMLNIILSGSPGIGKTSTMLFVAKALLGKYYNECVIELNASDERGVKTVQDVIEYFCKKKVDFSDGIMRHKIVLLDEADNMTKKAQQFISKLMEEYYNTTRFVFTCNNSTDIIETIQSRCVIFRYHKLKQDEIENKLITICDKEKIPHTAEGISVIAKISAGDLRQAINNLQITYNGYINVIPENVYKLCDTPHPVIIEQIFISCYKKDIREALRIFNDLKNKGYSSSDISLSMVETLKNMDKEIIDEKTKIQYLDEVCKTCVAVSKGLNTPLQITGLIAMLCKK
jgi:replication factor C subunit 2/4